MYGVSAGSAHKQYALGSVPRGRPWDEFKPKQIGRKQTSLAAQKAEARRREEVAAANPWQTTADMVGSFVPSELAPPKTMAHPSRAARERSRGGAVGGSDALGEYDVQRERERREAVIALRERKARGVEDTMRWGPKAPAAAPGQLNCAPPAGFNTAGTAERHKDDGSSSRADQQSRLAVPDRRRMAKMLLEENEVIVPGQPSRVLLHKPMWMKGEDAPPARRTEKIEARRLILEAAAAEEVVSGPPRAHPLDPSRVIKPGGLWQGSGDLTHAEKVHLAVKELRRRQPQLSEIEALQKVGVALAQQVNAPDAPARDYYRMRGRTGA